MPDEEEEPEPDCWAINPPDCPYCASPMSLQSNRGEFPASTYWYECQSLRCGACSPRREDPAKAIVAAFSILPSPRP